MRVILVHHKPGTTRGSRLLSDLARELEESFPVEASLYTPGQMPTAGSGDIVFILMLTRGGHFHEALSKAYEASAVYGPIPYWITASYIAEAAGGRGERVLLAYHRARRMPDLQMRDIVFIAGKASSLLGVPVEPVEISRLGQVIHAYDSRVVVVPLTVTPSRLLGMDTSLLSITHSRRLLAGWITGILSRHV